MKKLKKTLATLTLAAAISVGVIWGASAGHSNQAGIVVADPQNIQKPGHVATVISTTPEIFAAAAAKELDAATSSGGPTAAMNQKIQEAV